MKVAADKAAAVFPIQATLVGVLVRLADRGKEGDEAKATRALAESAAEDLVEKVFEANDGEASAIVDVTRLRVSLAEEHRSSKAELSDEFEGVKREAATLRQRMPSNPL